MKRLSMACLARVLPAVVGLTACGGSAEEDAAGVVRQEAGGTTTSTTQAAIPMNFVLQSADSLACLGEPVRLQGTLHCVTHQSANDNTGTTVNRRMCNPAGISGVGLVTGASFRGTGSTSNTTVEYLSGSSYRRQNSFRIIGQSSAENYLVRETRVVETLADGTEQTTLEHVSVECR